MKNFFFSIALGVCASGSLANDLNDLTVPCHLFVNDLFKSKDYVSDFRGMWTSAPESSPTRKDPNGGYLFRFLIQFDGSKDTLAFVASDRFGDLRRDAPSWSIFQTTADGEWRPAGVSEVIQRNGIFLDHSSRSIIQEFPDRFESKKSFIALQINPDGKIEKKQYTIGEFNAEGRQLPMDRATAFTPKIEKIPLGAYLRSPQARWRSLSRHGMAAQSLDIEDGAILASNYEISWNEALRLLDDISIHGKGNQALNPNKDSAETPRIEKSAPKEDDTEEPVASNRLITWMSILLALGLLWLLLKKRS